MAQKAKKNGNKLVASSQNRTHKFHGKIAHEAVYENKKLWKKKKKCLQHQKKVVVKQNTKFGPDKNWSPNKEPTKKKTQT